VAPVLVTRITRSDGTVLYEHEHTQEKVLDAGLADQVSDILQQVIQRGTGTRAKLDRPAAGKTGTTDDYRNAWFVGYTPRLSTAVWVGFSESQASMRPPATPIKVFGGTYPAQIWQRFMAAALQDQPAGEFVAPTTTTTLAPINLHPGGSALGPPTAVPDVTGLTQQEAVDILTYTGFQTVIAPSTDTDADPGTVVVQAPPGGTAPKGSTVTLEVA
jgi:penicillin-binding protein 1A